MPMISDPTMSGRAGRFRQLDYEKAFEYWTECGTLPKAAQALARDGYVNDDGEPFHVGTVRYGAWHWVIMHPEESLAIWQAKGHFPNGRDEFWQDWICKKCLRWAPNRARLMKFLEANDLVEYYKENYERKFANSE